MTSTARQADRQIGRSVHGIDRRSCPGWLPWPSHSPQHCVSTSCDTVGGEADKWADKYDQHLSFIPVLNHLWQNAVIFIPWIFFYSVYLKADCGFTSNWITRTQ